MVSSKSSAESHTLRLVERRGSKRAAQPLNLRTLPVYPVFEDEKLKGLDKKLVERKRAFKSL